MTDEPEVPMKPEGRQRRRLGNADLTQEQQAAVEARRADRETAVHQAELARDLEAYRQEYPPVRDLELIRALAALRRQREEQGLSLTDMSERRGSIADDQRTGNTQARQPDDWHPPDLWPRSRPQTVLDPGSRRRQRVAPSRWHDVRWIRSDLAPGWLDRLRKRVGPKARTGS